MRCVVYTKAFDSDRKLDGAVLQKDGVSKCNKSACEIGKWLRRQYAVESKNPTSHSMWKLHALAFMFDVHPSDTKQSLFKEICRQEFHRIYFAHLLPTSLK